MPLALCLVYVCYGSSGETERGGLVLVKPFSLIIAANILVAGISMVQLLPTARAVP